ncbi:hypothetical protein DVU_1776 [Nitratidesulfovibrio vulgaris str. Hildenborough]|uniref:Uncharacterized protein n=1 Tax=Nitratidesulfovibrio vulgaris (strain ATCC 29579 / DSM 644 / CCUG 34227 / NCIMB 8303 / VKM B-1760 / Hildenborough) TaxID=882 RepID=Q72B62_NITV2|nr:hypothetical protein DVU_1776 [Nitratidesulfovibrio vulgaris str. Hildenborough]
MCIQIAGLVDDARWLSKNSSMYILSISLCLTRLRNRL